MENLNRIKVVLVEQNKTKRESGWLNNLEKIVPPFLNGAPIRFNQI